MSAVTLPEDRPEYQPFFQPLNLQDTLPPPGVAQALLREIEAVQDQFERDFGPRAPGPADREARRAALRRGRMYANIVLVNLEACYCSDIQMCSRIRAMRKKFRDIFTPDEPEPAEAAPQPRRRART